MGFPAIPIISEIIGIGRTWLQGKQKVQEAKDARAAELVRQQGTWEEIMASGSITSWKDEWLTILFSIPLILAFFPAAVSHVHKGFEALKTMPEWYVYTLSVIVAASFGVRSVIGIMDAKAATAPTKG